MGIQSQFVLIQFEIDWIVHVRLNIEVTYFLTIGLQDKTWAEVSALKVSVLKAKQILQAQDHLVGV